MTFSKAQFALSFAHECALDFTDEHQMRCKRSLMGCAEQSAATKFELRSSVAAVCVVPGCADVRAMLRHRSQLASSRPQSFRACKPEASPSKDIQHLQQMTEQAAEAPLTDAQARIVAKRLAVTACRSKRNIATSPARKKQPVKAWTGLPAFKAAGADDINQAETTELIEAELVHLQQLPPQSAYVRHRKRLLQSALKLAKEAR